MASLAYIRNIWSASYSRKNEREADELGIKLAAMSCFDTRRAPKVFEKLHQYHDKVNELLSPEQVAAIEEKKDERTINQRGYQLSSFSDTHPPTMMRYDYLLDLSREENADKYSKQCNKTRRSFLKSLVLLQ